MNKTAIVKIEGVERESESYRKIANSRSLATDDFVFFSGSIPELEATRCAGMNVCLLSRREESAVNITFSPPMGSLTK